MDLVSGPRIVSGYLKATLEELADPGPLQIRIGGVQVPSFDSFRTDPRLPKWEINFAVPAGVAAGDALVAIHLGQRLIGQQRVQLEHQRDSADADK